MTKGQTSLRLIVVVVFAFLVITVNTTVSAQVLSTGDIVFTGYQASGPTTNTDQFVFVTLVPLPVGTIIKFTDNAWNSGSGTFNTTESNTTFTVTPSLIPAGEEIIIVLGPPATARFRNGTSAGTVVVVGPISLPTSGDQIIAYQGADLVPTTFISGIHMNVESVCGITTAAGWDPASCVFPISPANNTSMKPAALTTGVNAFWSPTEHPNGKFAGCGLGLSTPAAVRAAVNNPANWIFDDSIGTLPAWAPTSWAGCGFLNFPTAAPATISGVVTTSDGQPIGGVSVGLSGTEAARTLTDSLGQFRFINVETGGFYTVTPALANHSFSPSHRSFSLLGNQTDAAFTAVADVAPTANPLDTNEYFVRQQYLDFLGREPDHGGLEYWSGKLNQCDGDAACLSVGRVETSAAFFHSQEFQEGGSFVYRLYQGALGRQMRFAEFAEDRQQVLGGANLEANKDVLASAFVGRAEFLQKYQSSTTADSFVVAVLQNLRWTVNLDLSRERARLINRYNSAGTMSDSRALVVRDIAESAPLADAVYNPSFVLMEYFGYLHREIDAAGYNFWLRALSAGPGGNYRGMVCSFITSTEYQHRFGTVVTRSNNECASVR